VTEQPAVRSWHTQKRLTGSAIHVGNTVELNDDYSVKTKAISHIQSIITNQLQDAKTGAEDILKQAHQDAQDILHQAQQEAEKRLTDVELDARRQEAYQEGYNAGQKAILQECQTHLSLANSLIEQAQDAHDNLMHQSHDTLFAMAKQLAELILHDTLTTKPDYWVRLIAAAQQDLMGQMVSKAGVVHIHPDTLAALQHVSPQSLVGLSHLEFRSDPKYPKDRLYLDTSETSWDISPKTQLDCWLRDLKTRVALESETHDAELS
jgi:flagellar assembly protein FliH